MSLSWTIFSFHLHRKQFHVLGQQNSKGCKYVRAQPEDPRLARISNQACYANWVTLRAPSMRAAKPRCYIIHFVHIQFGSRLPIYITIFKICWKLECDNVKMTNTPKSIVPR